MKILFFIALQHIKCVWLVSNLQSILTLNNVLCGVYTGMILMSECFESESCNNTPLIIVIGVIVGIIGALVGASGLIITCVVVKRR